MEYDMEVYFQRYQRRSKKSRRRSSNVANLFWIAVIVIAVLVFIIWKQHRIIVRKTAKEPEEL